MKLGFVVSSIGDTDLALETAKVLRKQGHQTTFISVTTVAENRIIAAAKLAPITHYSLYDLLILNPEFPLYRCTRKQLDRLMQFVSKQRFSHMYVGLPSERNNEIALQIAERIRHIPVLMASEFMFTPNPAHSIWQHLFKLQQNSKLHWLVSLKSAYEAFKLDPARADAVGHLSIDRALQTVSFDTAKIRQNLGAADSSLMFLSSSTQPADYDARFLHAVLSELPNHATIQIRLGLHPGIRDLDTYLSTIIPIYLEHDAPKRFQIIVPPSWKAKFKRPKEHIDNPELASLFVFKEISGAEASAAAKGVMQSCAGALLNEAVVRGKPVYATLSEEEPPYLPITRFASSPDILFKSEVQPRLEKHHLGLSEQTAAEASAEVLLRMH